MLKKQQGFTLLEIFVALAIGLVIIGGTLSVFVGLKTTTTETSSMGELQENGRFAVNLITDDLLRQNFWGDLTGNLSFPRLIQVPNSPANDCVGDGLNNGSFPQQLGSFRAISVNVTTSETMLSDCITNAAYDASAPFNSDIIQIKRAVALPIIPIPPALVVVPGQLNDNRYYIQSNGSSANIFPGNTAVPVLTESRIWEYQHHIYYIRNETISDEDVPVLVQGRLQQGDNPIGFNMLVEGIEKIHYMFGVDTDGDGVVNGYMSSAEMNPNYWDNGNNVRILAVKLYVLVRAIRQDFNYENDNVYQLGDVSFDANGDNYRRLLLSSTVTLYNARMESW